MDRLDEIRKQLAWGRASIEDIDYLLSQLEAARKVVEAARRCLDDTSCRLDHEGYCQNHGLQIPCEQAQLKESLAALDAAGKGAP